MSRVREEATRLLNDALFVLWRDGKVHRAGDVLTATATIGDVTLMMREPPHRLPKDAEPRFRAGRDANPKTDIPPKLGLDIRKDGRVFSVLWRGSASLTIVRFRRGEWEAELRRATLPPA
ncbi:hypothetical protein [Lichenibacterium dinghuense]|uniref:hypothetical protein n=1 Tax=Lichenibacterium dinghuense TaxID=2895977 RepID=UPI001F22D0B7|nr:hypothetical protein [Lichenibacterium sp. 6Y81]